MFYTSFTDVFRDDYGRPRHTQGGTSLPSPSGKVVKCFVALVITVKRSVGLDELFMHYLQNIRRLLGALPQTPIRAPFYVTGFGT